MDTCREPKAESSASCTCAIVRPSGASLSRSTCTASCRLRLFRLVATSWMPGTDWKRRKARSAQRYTSSRSRPVRVYWYCACVSCPPMFTIGGFWMNTRTPGMPPVLPRSCCTIWSGLSARSCEGLSLMKIWPLLPEGRLPPTPTVEFTDSTFGSWMMMSATACCSLDIAWKETSCPPSVKAISRPESPLGRKPFCTIPNRYTEPPIVPRKTTRTTAWWRSVQESVAS